MSHARPPTDAHRTLAGMGVTVVLLVLTGYAAVVGAPSPEASAGLVTVTVFAHSVVLAAASHLLDEETKELCAPRADVCAGG